MLEIGILHILYSDWLVFVISGCEVYAGTFIYFQLQQRLNDKGVIIKYYAYIFLIKSSTVHPERLVSK